MPGYQTLKVWQKAMALSKLVYALTDRFPKKETYNLIDQMNRAAISVCSNLAEGSRKIHKAEKRHYYTIAYASASELETQILLSKNIYPNLTDSYATIQDVADHVCRLLNLLLRKFR